MRHKLVTLLATAFAGLMVAGLAATSASAIEVPQPEISPTPSKSGPITFSGTVGHAYFQVYGGPTFPCEQAGIKGEFVSATKVEAKLTFSECANMPPSFVGTEALVGHIGSTEAFSQRVGIELEPASGELFAGYFGYSFDDSWLTGSIIGTVGPRRGVANQQSPVNTELESMTLEYEYAEEHQVPQHFWDTGEKGHVLNAPGYGTVLVEGQVKLEDFQQYGDAVQVEIKDAKL